jgi:hypothetical protein
MFISEEEFLQAMDAFELRGAIVRASCDSAFLVSVQTGAVSVDREHREVRVMPAAGVAIVYMKMDQATCSITPSPDLPAEYSSFFDDTAGDAFCLVYADDSCAVIRELASSKVSAL